MGVVTIPNVDGPRLLVVAFKQETYDNPQFQWDKVVQKAHMDLPFLFSEAMKTMGRKHASEHGDKVLHRPMKTW
jgi:hypothetical protein